MSEALGGPSSDTIGHESRNAATRGAADWLCLAAAPTFAIMALLEAVTAGADMICSGVRDAFPFDDMVTMYLIMSAFHLPPWLRLISGRGGWSARSGSAASGPEPPRQTMSSSSSTTARPPASRAPSAM